MHALDVLDSLVKFLSDSLQDYLLQTESGNEVPPAVHDGYLPPKLNQRSRKDEDSPVQEDCPFVIVRYLDDDDEMYNSNRVAYRIVVGTYSEDEQHGWRETLALMIRIKSILREQQIIGSANLVGSLKTHLFEEQRKPHWHGYMVAEFEIPQVKEKNKEMMPSGFY